MRWNEMSIVEVYVEHPIFEINQTYSYQCEFDVVEGQRVLVPFGNTKQVVGLVHKVHEEGTSELELKRVISVIDKTVLLNDELFGLAKFMEQTTIAPYMACIQAMLPTILKPKSNSQSAVLVKYVSLGEMPSKVTPKQMECVDYVREHGKVLYSEVRSLYANVALPLVKKGALLLVEEERKYQEEEVCEQYRVPVLSEEQKAGIASVEKSQGHETFLLYGVTGSGKTEVYLQLAQHVIEQGKEVILLVPEISLTPQMVQRVKGRFGAKVAIYHSHLSAQEKYEQYQRVCNKEVQIVVGTRSSVFVPFENLGLIIMDEEHDKSYKQESLPRYHTRDIASWRAKYHNCPLLLASATPSFESYARALKNVYTLLTLTKRIYTQMPKVELVDMKGEIRKNNPRLLSLPLRQAMEEVLAKGEQVILLFNRRGYAPVMECKKCHQVITCPHCDIALSYHKEERVMKCHYCDYVAPFIKVCPSCSHTEFTFAGHGIQQLEEELKETFATYRILRMDRDTTSRKNQHEQLIQSFANHQADILIGTQMIAKGLDFESVSVVGILNADMGFNRPDFRSIEETYQFLSQACGRCGRSEKQGQVFIQTYDPTHYAYGYIKQHDYPHFFAHEMKYRHRGNYPPYCYMASILIQDKNQEKALNFGQEIEIYLKVMNIDGKVYPLSDLVKVQDQYRYRILVKMKDASALQEVLRGVIHEFKEIRKSNVGLLVDMNPVTV